MPDSSINWKTQVLIACTAGGALIGLVTGFLLSRTAEERGNVPPEIKTVDALKVLIAVIGVVRGISSLGSPD